MPKKIALITVFACVAELHRQTLARLFGERAEIHCFSYDRYDVGEQVASIHADLFVLSIYQIYETVRPFIPPGVRTVIINNTISQEQYQRIAQLPAGMPVLLVNYSLEMTMDTISLFHQIGLNHLEFVPYYPGAKNVPELEVAVTPGERKHVPSFVKRVIDIGDRIMDARTIINVATALGLEGLLKETRFTDYFKSIRMSPDSVTTLFKRTNVLEGQLSSLLDVLDDGIVIIETNGLVSSCNRKAHELLGPGKDLEGARAVDLIPHIPFARVLESAEEVDYTLVRIQSRNISVKVVPVLDGAETRGALAIINTFEEKEKSQQRLRSQLLGKGHRSRYAFSDILTRDPAFQEIKQLAQKKAKSDASVLIIGETGTGKELFAHAIHNASRRTGWQFVTVNCAALPESLLESELFGYEEGAFTGARKGGKPGLFELAHKGTIFLDEIGELELNLQARLLRVLESHEVMRIGGDRIISVDIRIIAATNKDLWQLVNDGKFREDLYYRLKALPIRIPPLRERPDDILLLLEHFQDSARGHRFRLVPSAANLLWHYPWKGNVRELKNVVDYLANLDKPSIDELDLAPILNGPVPSPRPAGAAGASLPLWPRTRMAPAPDPELAGTRFLLECLAHNHRHALRSGRRSLSRQARDQEIGLTEAQVRSLLARLEAAGLVRSAGGGRGTTITRAGFEALEGMAAAGADPAFPPGTAGASR